MSGNTGGVSVESAEALPCNREKNNATVKASIANNVCRYMLRTKSSAKDQKL